jgi:hypothetical protein
MGARREITAAVVDRYRSAGRADKGLILDELCAVTGWHRKHAGCVRMNSRKPASSSLKRQVIVVVADERLAMDVHLEMPMGHLRVLAAALMSGKVGLPAGEQPLQVLVLDGQPSSLPVPSSVRSLMLWAKASSLATQRT